MTVKSRVKKLSRRDPGTARVSPRVCFGSAPGASASASVSGQRKSFAQPSETQQPGDPRSSRSTREYALRPGRIAADAAETRATRRAPRRTDPCRTLLEGHDAKKPRLKAKMFVALRCGWRRRRPRNEGVRDSNPRAGFRWIAGISSAGPTPPARRGYTRGASADPFTRGEASARRGELARL